MRGNCKLLLQMGAETKLSVLMAMGVNLSNLLTKFCLLSLKSPPPIFCKAAGSGSAKNECRSTALAA